MRKVINFTHATLDGYIDEPYLWSFPYSNKEVQAYLFDMHLAADALLLGRISYEGMAQSWPSMGGNPKGGGEPLFRAASAGKVDLLDTKVFATGAVIHAYGPSAP
jgi:hypothetical protein